MTNGLNKRLLVQLQLRCVAALAVTTAAAGALSLWASRALLPWGPAVLAAAEVAFYFIWHSKKSKLDTIPEVHEVSSSRVCLCRCVWLQLHAHAEQFSTRLAADRLQVPTACLHEHPLLCTWSFLSPFSLLPSPHKQIPQTPPQPDDHDGWHFFEKWQASSHYNVRFLAVAELMKHWFDNVPTMEIRRGNAAELIARGYFYKTL